MNLLDLWSKIERDGEWCDGCTHCSHELSTNMRWRECRATHPHDCPGVLAYEGSNRSGEVFSVGGRVKARSGR